jgi:hypothetical protein
MITNLQIEQFYNKDRESDVKYITFNNISPTLVKIIKEILTNK